MTNEFAIIILNSLKQYYNDKNEDGYVGFADEDNEAIDIAIKALEQQPCEDCISRQAVEEITWEEPSYTDALNVLTEIREKIRQLPSVTPHARVGHWIDIMIGDMPAQACDRCNTFYPLSYTGGGHRYCPNCGAKMEEEE